MKQKRQKSISEEGGDWGWRPLEKEGTNSSEKEGMREIQRYKEKPYKGEGGTPSARRDFVGQTSKSNRTARAGLTK